MVSACSASYLDACLTLGVAWLHFVLLPQAGASVGAFHGNCWFRDHGSSVLAVVGSLVLTIVDLTVGLYLPALPDPAAAKLVATGLGRVVGPHLFLAIHVSAVS